MKKPFSTVNYLVQFRAFKRKLLCYVFPVIISPTKESSYHVSPVKKIKKKIRHKVA